MNPLRHLKVITYSLGLIRRAAPKEAAFLSLCLAIQGLIVLKESTHFLTHFSVTSLSFPWVIFVLWGIILLSETLFEPILSFLRLQLNEKVLSHFNILLMKKANKLQGLDFLENRQSASEIKQLKEETRYRPLNLIYTLTGGFRECIGLVSVLFLLSTTIWWLPCLIILSAIPHSISTIWREKHVWDYALLKSPETQQMAELSKQTLDLRAAKEIRLFGFGDFLIKKYQTIFQDFQKQMETKRRSLFTRFLLLSFPSIVGDFFIFYFVIHYALSGQLQGGEVVMAIQGLITVQRTLGLLTQHLGMFAQSYSFFSKFKTFIQSATSRIASPKKPKIVSHLTGEIRLSNVSFTYPEGRKALDNINLTLRANETVALVGENGAGKSTLAKLLCRFYDPTSGSVFVDENDLKSLDVEWWRQHLSCVLQDFAEYPLTVKENIGIGDWQKMDDTSLIKRAAQKGGAHTLKLAKGYDTFLGKPFGGTSLSGGEWQKIALSRAFMRPATFLILDEPTAALDARSEREIFHSFTKLTKEKTALLITHRLGSIAFADRILVMKKGKIIEDGTHNTLLAAQGEYSSLYAMQAENYK